MKSEFFNTHVEKFLGQRLPERLAEQISFADLSLEGRDFVLRMLTLMKRASYPATDFNAFLMRAISVTISGGLLCSRQGRIPPITMPGRHHKMDNFVAQYAGDSADKRPLFIDVGCGFPPVTTMDTAQNLPDWSIIGIDRYFADYVVYDADGHYACFDHDGNFIYFQAQLTESGRKLNDRPEVARTHFEKLFSGLFPSMQKGVREKSTTVERDGNRLIHDHIRDFENTNLRFIETDIMDCDLPRASCIRCMNVLLYFRPAARKDMLLKLGASLHDEGMLVAGFNHILGSSARYAVYNKATGKPSPVEFAFSLDNLRPIALAPWYSLLEDDPEANLLADLTGAIRNDDTFWSPFNRRVDELLDHHDICHRTKGGFLDFPEKEMPVAKLIGSMWALWQQLDTEGYADGAVDALKRAGHQAWKNRVGDIAVKPPPGTLPLA